MVNCVSNQPNTRYSVGVRAERNGGTDVMVWYPAESSPETEPYDYHGLGRGKSEASLNAPPVQGESFPLILASHGIGTCAPDLWQLAESWASAGYVVAAPDHADAAMCHIGGGSDITPREFYRAAIRGRFDLGSTVQNLLPGQLAMVLNDISYRSEETYSTIDAAIDWSGDPSSFLYGMVDPGQIGIAGHSLGGWDSFYTAGAGMHCEGVPPEVCEAPPENLSTDRLIEYTCCSDAFRDSTTHGTHPNVHAVLGIGPGMIYFPNYLGLEDMEGVQTMFITEALPPRVDYWTNSGIPYEIVSPPRNDIVLWSNHMTVSASIDAIPFVRPLLPGSLWHRSALRAYSDWSTAFFDSSLKGDASGLEALRGGCSLVVKEKSWED